MLSKYRPLLIQLIGVALVAVAPLLLDPNLSYSFTEVMNIIAVFVGAISVYNARNFPGWQIAKTIASGLLTVVALANSIGSDGFSPREIAQVVIALVVTLAIAILGGTGNDSADEMIVGDENEAGRSGPYV